MSVPITKDLDPYLRKVLRLIPLSLSLGIGTFLYIGPCYWTLSFGILSGILITPFILAYRQRPQPRHLSPYLFGGVVIGLHIPLLRTALYPLTDWKAWLVLLAQFGYYLCILFSTHALSLLLLHKTRQKQPCDLTPPE
ncbi:MAG: hypothetical protein OJI67_20600 [Prosthecobacter sp.]|nr:hypothetical protein [Prosthecobacter sp.]